MKKLVISMIVMVCLLSIVGMAYANSGSAVIPHFWVETGGSLCRTVIYISNVTDVLISGKVTFFAEDGSILTTGLTGQNVSDFTTSVSDASCSFDLEGKTTGVIRIKDLSNNYGFGLIEWSQESDNVYGLVVHGDIVWISSNGESRFAIPINNGLPF